jgi:hypothetical protein
LYQCSQPDILLGRRKLLHYLYYGTQEYEYDYKWEGRLCQRSWMVALARLMKNLTDLIQVVKADRNQGQWIMFSLIHPERNQQAQVWGKMKQEKYSGNVKI